MLGFVGVDWFGVWGWDWYWVWDSYLNSVLHCYHFCEVGVYIFGLEYLFVATTFGAFVDWLVGSVLGFLKCVESLAFNS